MLHVEVREAAFSADEMATKLSIGRQTGALASFCGLCRDEDGRLAALELEHYPGMAERQLTRIGEEAMSRWSAVTGLVIVHRFGMIKPGETIVYVGATSRHRDASFDAVRFIMDYLKTDAPFWKKEHPVADKAAGAWVEAKSTDDAARRRWSR